jgi:hypothetical protein
LLGLKDVIDNEALLEVGVEVIVDGLCPAEELPGEGGSSFEIDLDVGV